MDGREESRVPKWMIWIFFHPFFLFIVSMISSPRLSRAFWDICFLWFYSILLFSFHLQIMTWYEIYVAGIINVLGGYDTIFRAFGNFAFNEYSSCWVIKGSFCTFRWSQDVSMIFCWFHLSQRCRDVGELRPKESEVMLRCNYIDFLLFLDVI